MTTSYSQTIQDLQAAQIAMLIKRHEKGRIRSLVEIGCGDGSFLNHAKKSISTVLGIEPSKRFSENAKKNGHEIINGFVSSTNTLTHRTFDAFASRQVFEHLSDPLDVLVGIRKMLNDGAVGLIEVPNGYRAIRGHRFYEFFPDHVNYYSVNSLVDLASQAGFNVICCGESFGGDYLELWVRNVVDIRADIKKIKECRKRVINSLGNRILENRDKKKVTAIWGCGAKTLSIFSAGLSDVSEFIYFVIDSDPNKQGFFVPNTRVKVVSPEQITGAPPDSIIVLALSYRDEIIKKIREIYPSCKEIITISNNGVLEIL